MTRAVRLDLVVAGHFAARVADAAHRGAQRGAGAAEVEADFVEFVEGLLHVFGRAALEHDVAALAVEGDQAGAVLLPDVAQLAQHVGGVVIARRRLNAQRVEFLRGREFGGDFREARNDAAAVAEHRDGAALPVAEALLVGMFELAEQVVHHRRVLRVAGVAQPLQAGDEARPRAGFELVEHGRRMMLRALVGPPSRIRHTCCSLRRFSATAARDIPKPFRIGQKSRACACSALFISTRRSDNNTKSEYENGKCGRGFAIQVRQVRKRQ